MLNLGYIQLHLPENYAYIYIFYFFQIRIEMQQVCTVAVILTFSHAQFMVMPEKKPKAQGPHCTENTTAMATQEIVNYYAIVFLLRPPFYYAFGPFLQRVTEGKCCKTQELAPTQGGI